MRCFGGECGPRSDRGFGGAVQREIEIVGGLWFQPPRSVRLRVDARVTLRVHLDPGPMGLDLGKEGEVERRPLRLLCFIWFCLHVISNIIFG